MKQFASLFLFFIMFLNVTAPLVEQLRGKVLYEISEDVDEKSKTEKEGKEEGKEKEAFLDDVFAHAQLAVAALKKTKNSLFSTDERLVSQLFAFTPERPPEA